jgi:hypothetical protein
MADTNSKSPDGVEIRLNGERWKEKTSGVASLDSSSSSENEDAWEVMVHIEDTLQALDDEKQRADEDDEDDEDFSAGDESEKGSNRDQGKEKKGKSAKATTTTTKKAKATKKERKEKAKSEKVDDKKKHASKKDGSRSPRGNKDQSAVGKKSDIPATNNGSPLTFIFIYFSFSVFNFIIAQKKN